MVGAQLFALSTPLITTSSGAKMGKSVSGAVWLNKEILSVYDYWQFWRNTEDGDVGRFMRIFTDLPIPEIERLEKLQGARAERRQESPRHRSDRGVARPRRRRRSRRNRAPHLRGRRARGRFADGHGEAAGRDSQPRRRGRLVASNSEARKLIQNNGLKINDVAVSDPRLVIDRNALTGEGVLKLSSGKKKHVLVKPA